ncbi:MAG TPA: complex I subunit 1 family protein, partial [Caldilineaceae bacterium]|nr:complex I subunit 1 family protein [Caldilineaceae bacterium]
MDWLNLLILPLLRSVVLIVILLTGFAYLTWYERKLLARFQVRYGPNRAGPYGLLQPAADAIKAFFKEEIVPNHVDRWVYLMAPALALIPALVIWAVIPVAKGVPAIADVNIGFLWILAIAGVESYGVILAGWSSNNNYSLLGA